MLSDDGRYYFAGSKKVAVPMSTETPTPTKDRRTYAKSKAHAWSLETHSAPISPTGRHLSLPPFKPSSLTAQSSASHCKMALLPTLRQKIGQPRTSLL